MNKISGYVCIKNGFSLDYCFKEAIESLLPVSDEVVVSDGESEDGTKEFLDKWATQEPKLRVITFPWPNFKGEPRYWNIWQNFTREQLKYPIQLALDGDEVLGAESYPIIQEAAKYEKCLWFRRLNFFRDAQHVSPDGHLVGCHVVRLGPTNLFMPSDEPHIPEDEMRLRAGWPPEISCKPNCKIYHYGFLRRNFIKKARVVLDIAAGTMDSRLENAEKNGTPWEDVFLFEEPQGDDHHIVRAPVLEFNEPHPEIIRSWLTERGYNPG